MARIVLTPAAKREYKRLPRDVRQAVRTLLGGDFCMDPLAIQFRVRKVQIPFVGYRVRLGNYRLLFDIASEMIIVYRIRHRKDAYK